VKRAGTSGCVDWIRDQKSGIRNQFATVFSVAGNSKEIAFQERPPLPQRARISENATRRSNAPPPATLAELIPDS
jgi:hypothetical protein